jgi:hypothetical protein
VHGGDGAVALQGDPGVATGAASRQQGGAPSEATPPAGVTVVAYQFDDTATLPATSLPAAAVPAGYEADPLSFGDDDPWPSHAARRGLHLKAPTAVLAVLLVAAGAFWGGAAVQKSRGGSGAAAGTSAAASRFRSLLGGAGAAGASSAGSASRTGASGAASLFRGFGASTAAATGEFTARVGNTIYITTTAGTLVKVVVGPSTKVTRDANASVSSLKTGDTVVVEGSTAKDGTVTATSISATESGVTAAGGFGGGGFGGGGAAAGG